MSAQNKGIKASIHRSTTVVGQGGLNSFQDWNLKTNLLTTLDPNQRQEFFAPLWRHYKEEMLVKKTLE
eukprot:6213426-Ditylum_brightwellii.AAC.1